MSRFLIVSLVNLMYDYKCKAVESPCIIYIDSMVYFRDHRLLFIISSVDISGMR